MRSAIERLFGWDETQQEASFNGWFNADEVSIIVADAIDIGWIQRRFDNVPIFKSDSS